MSTFWLHTDFFLCCSTWQVRSMLLFSQKDHPNTLAAVAGEPDHLWVLLHNLGDVSD
jgi:hypothetical protein